MFSNFSPSFISPDIMEQYRFFNRDLSWLGFNSRVLEEAADERVPLLERIKFLSIFSSNLDEFYRVRMPVINALKQIGEKPGSELDAAEHAIILLKVQNTIARQQAYFGEILTQQLIPELKKHHVDLIYNELLPEALKKPLTKCFLSEVLAFLKPVTLNKRSPFFPENNKLYLLITLQTGDDNKLVVLNIPSDELPRFYTHKIEDKQYIVFLDDVIGNNLSRVFKDGTVTGCYSFKVTRDADLDLKDDYPGNLSKQIEKQLLKRDKGLATRFLHDAEMPVEVRDETIALLNLKGANAVPGGHYHNLKDLFSFPLKLPAVSYDPWPAIDTPGLTMDLPIAEQIAGKDVIIHPPYNNYDAVLRFFNEAAINPDVEEIYVTLYRVASDSRIVNALISAAENGKQVQVVIELKARFDEANNLKWAKKMKKAGIKIIYSITALKVHAKVALVKTRHNGRVNYTGLLATGNLNETTAKFYTDHILFTANKDLLREMELLFILLAQREKPDKFKADLDFKQLLVAQFNLQTRFLELIDNEIELAKQGSPAEITIKLNNLEEHQLISKLYDASNAGVKVSLIIRSICCLIPGVKGMSENITVRRIVDRYLEHGRIFIFNNNGDKLVFMGSADWMNRNIYNRIEVCFPVYDAAIKNQVIDIIKLQLQDNTKAVMLDQELENVKIHSQPPLAEAQFNIYQMLSGA